MNYDFVAFTLRIWCYEMWCLHTKKTKQWKVQIGKINLYAAHQGAFFTFTVSDQHQRRMDAWLNVDPHVKGHWCTVIHFKHAQNLLYSKVEVIVISLCWSPGWSHLLCIHAMAPNCNLAWCLAKWEFEAGLATLASCPGSDHDYVKLNDSWLPSRWTVFSEYSLIQPQSKKSCRSWWA